MTCTSEHTDEIQYVQDRVTQVSEIITPNYCISERLKQYLKRGMMRLIIVIQSHDLLRQGHKFFVAH